MIVCNGQFPGPTLEANWGDWIEVTVNNQIEGPEETTLIHWHGLNQPGTPWYDGVISVDQCPIVPGGSLTYKFRADEYGTSWWHSHQAAQYTQGLFGPIVIHGPSEYVDYDEDLGPVLLSDWYHAYYTDIEVQVNSPVPQGARPPSPQSQSNLVNGVGKYGCGSAPGTSGPPFPNSTTDCSNVDWSSWKVEAGKKYRMRLVNAGSTGFETVSIDGHKLTIIANDFVPVQPYEVDFVRLAVGQRTDIVFEASGNAGDSYWFRAYNELLCGQPESVIAGDGRGVIAYGDDAPSQPTSTGTAPPPNPSCGTDDLSLTEPLAPLAVEDPDVTLTFQIAQQPDQNGVFKWFMNGVVFVGNADQPVLLSTIQDDQTSFPAQQQVYDLGTNKTVRVIIQNPSPAPHPMHIHGHDFQVLANGQGTWDGTIVRPSNPQRRDTQMMWGGPAIPSYTVLQWYSDNPGVWPLHCHLAWHLVSGMIVLMLEQPDALAAMDADLPPSIEAGCKAFRAWEAANGSPDDGTGTKMRRSPRDFRRW